MKEVTYTKSSEWVSPAHPDRAADCIASEIINKIYSLDGKNAHAAIEVAIFDNKVIVGGEAKTTLDLSPEALKPIVQHVLREVGYNLTLREKFSKEDVYIDSDYEVLSFVNKQSPDIAKGTTDLINGEPGFNDQGTYCGFASNKTKNRLSYEHYLATSLGEFLYRKAKQTDFLGVDIKILVQVKYSMDNDKFIGVQGITVACPTVRYSDKCKEYWKSEKDFDDFCLATIRSYCADWFFMNFNYELDMDKLLINGTGVYHSHGPKADAGLCLSENTLVECLDSTKKIRDIKVGDMVYTDTGLSRVSSIYNNGEKPTAIIETFRGHTIEATLNHPFLVAVEDGDPIWKTAAELKEGDCLIKRKNFKDIQKDAHTIKLLFFKRNKGNKKIEERSKRIIDTHSNDFYYHLGWLVGDGNVTHKDYLDFIYNPYEKEEKETIQRVLTNIYGKENVYCYEYSKITKGNTSRYDSRFKIISQDFKKELLLKCGIEEVAAPYKKVPLIVWKSSSEHQCSFLSGLFDTDGCASKIGGRNKTTSSLVLTSSSLDLLQEVAILLNRNGIQSSIYKHYNREHISKVVGFVKASIGYNLSITGYNSVKNFIEKIGFRLNRKQKRLEDNFKKMVRRGDTIKYVNNRKLIKEVLKKSLFGKDKKYRKFYDKSSYRNKKLILADSLYKILEVSKNKNTPEYAKLEEIFNYFSHEKIKSIKLSKSRTFDISLEDNKHVFVANGYLVHNTGRKLVVNQCGNFAAGGSMIKPILASDRLLNIYARHIAKVAVDAGLGNEVTVELSASIGQTKIGSLRLIGIEKHYDIIYNYFMGKPFSPNYLNEKWRTLQRNNFNKVVFMNFFGSDRYDVEPWEDTEEDVKELQRLIWDAEHNWK